MKTEFSDHQLAQPVIAKSEQAIRKCVHCGFCTATCPTYVLLGNELDSPRGRIYLIKNMLETDQPASDKIVKHVDRCLSCLSCMSTCPSDVNYMHLVDTARIHIEKTYRRPFADRVLRRALAFAMSRSRVFGPLMQAAKIGTWFRPLFPSRLKTLLELVPKKKIYALPKFPPPVSPAQKPRVKRVALMPGCVQPVLDPEINAATVRILTRHGVEVITPKKSGCCGALAYHLGKEKDALAFARKNIDAWLVEIEGEGLDAIIVNMSGCGTTVKDYGQMFAEDCEYREKAQRVAVLTRDISEFLAELELTPRSRDEPLTVAYHSACSMQHGQKLKTTAQTLLKKMHFIVKEVPESHLCCGSAGVYNILQAKIAEQLRNRKINNIKSVNADVIAAGNLGCINQIGSGAGIPILHTVQLLDWATGGPRPDELDNIVSN